MSMELNEFIRRSIAEVMKGISSAQKDAVRYGGRVSPKLAMRGATPEEIGSVISASQLSVSMEKVFGETGERVDRSNLAAAGLLETRDGNTADIIEFDLLVSTSSSETEQNESEAKMGGGLKIMVFEAEGSGGKKAASEKKAAIESANRIKFRVIVQYP